MRTHRKNILSATGLITIFLLGSLNYAFCQQDKSHFSTVFNREKPYMIFLPDDYYISQKRYPVIYYFHGNKGTHKLDIEGVEQLVKKNSVILVAWNGRSVSSDIRPYNIGYHSNIKYEVQFKNYFPELVACIDSSYRTLTDRSSRAIIGHSMGGFMSFFIAGEYPQMIGCAVNDKGSPEFFVGYPQNHTLYSMRYMFKNLYGIALKFNNSTNGELTYLNREVNEGAQRELGLNYHYRFYEGDHRYTPEQFKEDFLFVLSSFKKPASNPPRWNHADLYPDFNIWGYQFTSNLNQPGYIDVKGVTNAGLKITTMKWQPHGIPVPGVLIKVKTAPVYLPDSKYTLLDYNEIRDTMVFSTVTSDDRGCIQYLVNSEPHQIGIFRKNSPPEIVYIAHKVNENGIFLPAKKGCNLKLRLLNKGGSNAQKINITISTLAEGVTVTNPVLKISSIPSGKCIWLPVGFKIKASSSPPSNGAPFRIRFNLLFTDNTNHTWKDEFNTPVFFDVPEFTHIGIDDGDSEIFGSGNGNNIAEPGETVMVYEISHRTRLYYDDPYIDDEHLHVDLQPDKWGDGYALSSLIHISKDCPPGHKIKFLASYEVKEWKTIKRNVTWGQFTITIGNAKD